MFFEYQIKAKVYVNVYNFFDCFNRLECIGLGVYHTGVEIEYFLVDQQRNVEYMYYGYDSDETGVIEITPETAAYTFNTKIELGSISMSYSTFQQIYSEIRKQFPGNKYDLLKNNCNHFANVFCERLIDVSIPSYIFRITDCLNTLRCCIPNCILNGRLDWFRSNSEDQQQQNDQNKQSIAIQKDSMIIDEQLK